MKQSVDRFIRRHRLIENGAVIVVGVSGGPDSMALLHYLYENQKYWQVKVIACCVDHMLRGEQSRADLDFVASFCNERDILFEGVPVNVSAYKKTHHVSTQVAARDCRYNVFKEVMEKHHASHLALGHHGDDQVETMLMRQVRGSFGKARSGIPVKRPFAGGVIIRPFLTITKVQTEFYCKQVGIEPRRDESNDSATYTRNRFRQQVLPFLKSENPLVHQRFQHDSEVMYDDDAYLHELALSHLETVITKQEASSVTVSLEKLKMIPIPLQRRLIHLILNYLYHSQNQSSGHLSIHIEELLYLFDSKQTFSAFHLPDGLVARRSYNQCVLAFQAKPAFHQSYCYPLDIPGSITVPLGELKAKVTQHYPKELEGQSFYICDLDQVKHPLQVRSRQMGDRISPKGMSGSKKAKDIFIDRKVDHEKRATWPIIVDSDGTILWIPLLKHSGVAAVTSATTTFLILSFEPTDNSGGQK